MHANGLRPDCMTQLCRNMTPSVVGKVVAYRSSAVVDMHVCSMLLLQASQMQSIDQ